MNTAKHLNGSSSPLLPKRPFLFWNKKYLLVMVLVSLLGTMLDHIFVEKKYYEFPIRPLPQYFSINIGFTFVVLPLFILFYLHMMKLINQWGKAGLILFISLLMPIFEKIAELCGLFAHSANWNHLYTFFGYLVFLPLVYSFYHWVENK